MKGNVPTGYLVKSTPMSQFNHDVEVEPERIEFIEEFRGWRLEITNPAACGFDVDLEAGPTPQARSIPAQ